MVNNLKEILDSLKRKVVLSLRGLLTGARAISVLKNYRIIFFKNIDCEPDRQRRSGSQ
jgi:hypothetical protein